MSNVEAGRWHADGALVDRYLAGAVDMAVAASLEAHLTGCAGCRDRVTRRAPARVVALVDTTWDRVREAVVAPTLPLPVRMLRRLGMRESTGVLLAATRSMSTAWAVATVIVLAFAALGVLVGIEGSRALYLIVAPLIPVAGVAFAFDATADPAADLVRVTPYPAARLVLIRAAAVAVTSIPLAVGIGLATPGIAWLAILWLVPALAFILLVLAASTWVDPVPVGAAVALLWAAGVGHAAWAGAPLRLVQGTAQFGYLALAIAGATVLAIRIRHSALGALR